MNAIPFLGASFPTTPTILDVADEDLFLDGLIYQRFYYHFLLEGIVRLSNSEVAPRRLAMVVPQVVLFGVRSLCFFTLFQLIVELLVESIRPSCKWWHKL